MSDQSYNEIEKWFATAESDASLWNREAGQTRYFPVGKTQAHAFYRNASRASNLIEISIQTKQGKILGATTIMRAAWEKRPTDDREQFAWACNKAGVSV